MYIKYSSQVLSDSTLIDALTFPDPCALVLTQHIDIDS